MSRTAVITYQTLNFGYYEVFKRNYRYDNYGYDEVEFVCYNSYFPDGTKITDQIDLYNDLKGIEGLLPYRQDWSDEYHKEISLAVIILDNDKSKKEYSEMKRIIIKLAKKNNIKIDLNTSGVSNSKVDSIVNGTLEGLIKE